MTRRFCSWAACRNPASAEVEGYWMCRPHIQEHWRMQAEQCRRDCDYCFLPFTSTNPRRRRCDNCTGLDRRPSYRQRTP